MDSDRLARLANILNESVSSPFERIDRLTREVNDRSGLDVDDLDRVTMRLLLDEYTNALAHLRDSARERAAGVDAAPAALKDVRRYLHS